MLCHLSPASPSPPPSQAAPRAAPVAAARAPVRVEALFGLGGGKAKVEPYVCLDCGWVYTGPKPWSEVPATFKCPKCGSGKNRFKKGTKK